MKLDGLDHVAIEVENPDRSAAWYVKTLGFERRYQGVWGDIPIFVCAGSTGLAIFPKATPAGGGDHRGGRPGLRHVAFRADRAEFARARQELEAQGIATEFSDHDISHSIYFSDPDGFHLEITTYDLLAEQEER